MQLKDQIKAEAINNILRAKAKKYADLAKMCSECAGQAEDIINYSDNKTAKDWHHRRATEILQRVRAAEKQEEIAGSDFVMLMQKHQTEINDAMGAAQRIADSQERQEKLKEIYKALRELPAIEELYLLYSDYTEEDDDAGEPAEA